MKAAGIKSVDSNVLQAKPCTKQQAGNDDSLPHSIHRGRTLNNVCRYIARCTVAVIALIALTACGGDGTGSGSTLTGPNTSYTVGGTVSGLVGQGLTIELLNLATMAHRATVLEQIDIVADGAFVFRILPSQSYGVAIVHQPHSPTQRCVVRNGQGVIGAANVTNVVIVCGESANVTRPKDNTIAACASTPPQERQCPLCPS